MAWESRTLSRSQHLVALVGRPHWNTKSSLHKARLETCQIVSIHLPPPGSHGETSAPWGGDLLR